MYYLDNDQLQLQEIAFTLGTCGSRVAFCAETEKGLTWSAHEINIGLTLEMRTRFGFVVLFEAENESELHV